MPRQVQVIMNCDVCERDEKTTEGQPFVIQLGTMKAREIILCAKHEKSLLTPLAELLPDLPAIDAKTTKGEGRRRGPNPPPLPVDPTLRIRCAMCEKELKNVPTLSAHVKSQHGLVFSEYRLKYLS